MMLRRWWSCLGWWDRRRPRWVERARRKWRWESSRALLGDGIPALFARRGGRVFATAGLNLGSGQRACVVKGHDVTLWQ